MVLASTLTELIVKLAPQFVEPSVMVDGCASPDGAGVILMCDLVALVSIRALSHTMSRGHKLCILDDHLATMLITMPFRANTRVFCEEEDVHGYIVAGVSLMSSVYSRLTRLLTESPIIDDEGDEVDVDYSPGAWKQAAKAHTSSPKLLRRMKKWSKGAKKLADGPVKVPLSDVLRTGKRIIRQETGKGGKTAPSLTRQRTPDEAPNDFVIRKRKPK